MRPQCASFGTCSKKATGQTDSGAGNPALANERGAHTTGTIVDATILHAPTSTKNQHQQGDPGMHQTKKANQWYFGMKAHMGVDRQDQDHPNRRGDGGKRGGFRDAARSVARRRNAGVGQSGVSQTDPSDPGMRTAGPELHPSALTLQGSSGRKWSGRRTGPTQRCGRRWSTCSG